VYWGARNIHAAAGGLPARVFCGRLQPLNFAVAIVLHLFAILQEFSNHIFQFTIMLEGKF